MPLLDEKEGTIFIKKALSWTTETGYRIKPTKNKQKRKIEVSPDVFAALARQSKAQATNKLRLGDLYRKDLNLVFCAEDGHYYHPNMPTRWFPKFCEKIGITRLVFHSLRHTHASHLLAAGEDISYVSRRLGHSDIAITYNTYFHLIPKEKRKSLEEFEKRLKK
ncbi:MAG: site-specific integrase [Pelosinus sp.]|nr:site-specific integrase [Pelosinus sp.]